MRITTLFVLAIAAGLFTAGLAYAFAEPLLPYPENPPSLGLLRIEAIDVSRGAGEGDGGTGHLNRNGAFYRYNKGGGDVVQIGFGNTLIFRDMLNGGPRMIVNDAGNVGIGTANPQSKLSVGGDGVASASVYGEGAIGLYGSGTSYGLSVSSGGRGVYAAGGTYGAYGIAGNTGTGVYGIGGKYGVYGSSESGWGIYCDGSCGGNKAWDSSSDLRLKKNIETIADALNKVTNLRGVTFDWKDDGSRDMGFIAQEVLPYVPEVVGYDELTGYYTMKTSEIAALLVEAVKELKAEKDAEIAELRKAIHSYMLY